jgi:hypothetical protein
MSGITTLAGADSCVGTTSAATYSRTDVKDVRASSNPEFDCAIAGRSAASDAQHINATVTYFRMFRSPRH